MTAWYNEISDTQRGIAFVEVVVAVTIVAVGILGAVGVFNTMVKNALFNGEELKALYLLEGGFEALRTVRDEDWANISSLTNGATYHLEFIDDPGELWHWEVTATPQVIEGDFYRTVVFTSISRDADGRITSSGTPDPNTRRVDITVSWPRGGSTTTRSASAYLINFLP